VVGRAAGRAGRARPVLRPQSAPAGGPLAICPHCWHVNPYAERLCARCGADMGTALQESGGLRRTAPVQSPVPVRPVRLTALQRWMVAAFVALLAAAALAGAFVPPGWRGPAAQPVPAGGR